MRTVFLSHTVELSSSTRWHIRSNLYHLLDSMLLGGEVTILVLVWRHESTLDTIIRQWQYQANADAGIWDHFLSSRYTAAPSKLQGPSILPKFPTSREDAVPPVGGAAFLRSPYGIAAALSLMRRLVLASLARHRDAPACGLLILATGLGYGREAPGDHACSPMRLHQTSVGSCP